MSVKKSLTNFRHGLQKARKHEEEDEQRALITICSMHEWKWPELRLLYHVPNGGWRSKIEAAILVALGVRPGVPDLVLPVARRGWFGACIELKRPGSITKLTPNQRWWLQQLNFGGYLSVARDNAADAWEFIRWYMDGERTISLRIPEEYRQLNAPVDTQKTIL